MWSHWIIILVVVVAWFVPVLCSRANYIVLVGLARLHDGCAHKQSKKKAGAWFRRSKKLKSKRICWIKLCLNIWELSVYAWQTWDIKHTIWHRKCLSRVFMAPVSLCWIAWNGGIIALIKMFSARCGQSILDTIMSMRHKKEACMFSPS